MLGGGWCLLSAVMGAAAATIMSPGTGPLNQRHFSVASERSAISRGLPEVQIHSTLSSSSSPAASSASAASTKIVKESLAARDHVLPSSYDTLADPSAKSFATTASPGSA